MLEQRPLLLVVFLVTTLWSILCNAAPTVPKTGSVAFVYRGDDRSPTEMKTTFQGEFRASGQTELGIPTSDTSLYAHVWGKANGEVEDNSGFVFTSSSKSRTIDGITNNSNETQRTGWVYKIHTAPNMVDVANTLLQYTVRPQELEYAALGGFRLDQVYSWTPIVDGVVGKEELNPDYNDRKFVRGRGVVDYTLAGFRPEQTDSEGNDVYTAWQQEPWQSHKPEVANCKRAIGNMFKGKSGFKKAPTKAPTKGPTVISSKQPPFKLPPTKQPPTKLPPTKQPPVQQPPVKQPPVKQPPVQQPPVQQPPIQQPPVQQPPVQQPPVEQPPVKQPGSKFPPLRLPPTQKGQGTSQQSSWGSRIGNLTTSISQFTKPGNSLWQRSSQPRSCDEIASPIEAAEAYLATIKTWM